MKGEVNSIIKNQGESLRRAGVELDFYMVSGRGIKGYLRNIKPLRNQIREGGYDVVHAHYAFTAYLASLATVGLRIPLVVSLMGSDIWVHTWYPFVVRIAAALKGWKAIIVKSAEMRTRVGIPRAIVIPNGVDMERFCELKQIDCQRELGWFLSDMNKHVLFPANPATARKNWPLAKGAVEILNRLGNYNIELHPMVGVKNEETPIWYNAADVVVLPSFYEGSANAVKETMACNKPIVTTDMGDCRERLEGLEGCYVANTYDVEEFAELLDKALKQGKTKGRERLLVDGIADYQIAERLMNIYKKINDYGTE